MRPAATLGLYAAGLALVFAAAVGVGRAVGPVGTAGASTAGASTPDAAEHATDEHAAPAADPADLAPGGLAVAADGYALELESATRPVGSPSLFGFTVTGPDGRPPTGFTPSSGKDPHLVVVRRDLTGYQQLHPASTTTVEGYDVALDGNLVAGTSSPLTLTVRRDGRPVTDLEPYLGAYRHLVAIREGDLAHLHVHPHGKATAGPDISFAADVPSAATYRLFLDFAHDGAVRTAELTAAATRSTGH